VSPIPESSPLSDKGGDSVSAMCQQLSQGLSLLSSSDDFLTDTPQQVSHAISSHRCHWISIELGNPRSAKFEIRRSKSEVCKQLVATYKIFPVSDLVFPKLCVCQLFPLLEEYLCHLSQLNHYINISKSRTKNFQLWMNFDRSLIHWHLTNCSPCCSL